MGARRSSTSTLRTCRANSWSSIRTWCVNSSVETPEFTRSTARTSSTTSDLRRGWRGRLKAHVKNQHGTSWTVSQSISPSRTSIYEIFEARLLRIANPIVQRGKLAQSRDMRRRIPRAIREKQYSEVSSLFGRKTTLLKVSRRASTKDAGLRKLLPQGGRLRGTLKGKVFSATARRRSDIRFNGKIYKSLSLAAGALWPPDQRVVVLAIGRRKNGVWLNKIRKAGDSNCYPARVQMVQVLEPLQHRMCSGYTHDKSVQPSFVLLVSMSWPSKL